MTPIYHSAYGPPTYLHEQATSIHVEIIPALSPLNYLFHETTRRNTLCCFCTKLS